MFLFQYDATYVKINYPPGPKEQQKKDDNERVDYIIKQSKNGPRNGFQYTGPAMLGISNGDGTRKWVEIGKDQTVWLVNEAGPISGTPTYYVFKPGVKDIHIYDVSSDPVDKMDEIKGKYNRYSVGGDEGDAIVLSKEDYNKYYANKETEEENKEGETKTKKEKLPAPGQIGLPGGGWSYANLQTQIFGALKDPLDCYPPGQPDGIVRVSVSTARLGRDMLAQDPPLRAAWVERANPIPQNPSAIIRSSSPTKFRCSAARAMNTAPA